MNYRKLILLSTLNLVDVTIIDRELVSYLANNVPVDKAITPKVLSSVCFMHWSTMPVIPSRNRVDEIQANLAKALAITLSNSHAYRVRRAEMQIERMSGWGK